MSPLETSKTFPGTIIPSYYLQHFFGAGAAANDPPSSFHNKKLVEKRVCVCAHFLAFSRGQESSLRSLPATPHPKDLVTVCGSGAEGPREFVTGSGGHLELCGNRPGRLRNTRPSPFMSQPTRDSDPPRLRSSRTESRAQGFSFWA
jgi:hypothetical protein